MQEETDKQHEEEGGNQDPNFTPKDKKVVRLGGNQGNLSFKSLNKEAGYWLNKSQTKATTV